jgi:hypothetical protein
VTNSPISQNGAQAAENFQDNLFQESIFPTLYPWLHKPKREEWPQGPPFYLNELENSVLLQFQAVFNVSYERFLQLKKQIQDQRTEMQHLMNNLKRR